MKNKLMTALTVVFAFCLIFTVYVSAFNQTDATPKAKSGCCAKKDACPMKDKRTANGEKTACCDRDDCCCKGDSCSMKKNGEKSEGKACCGGSCPMKKDAEKQNVSAVDMTNVVVASSGDGCCKPAADCCKGSGACCKNKKN